MGKSLEAQVLNQGFDESLGVCRLRRKARLQGFFLGGKGRDERYEKSQAVFLGERVSHIYIYTYMYDIYIYFKTHIYIYSRRKDVSMVTSGILPIFNAGC